MNKNITISAIKFHKKVAKSNYGYVHGIHIDYLDSTGKRYIRCVDIPLVTTFKDLSTSLRLLADAIDSDERYLKWK